VGLRLLFGEFADIAGRIDIGRVTKVGDARGYHDTAAIVPAGDWTPLTREDAERFRPDGATFLACP
jgi:hypothetical protein